MMASAIAGLLAQTVIVQRINLSPAVWLCTGLPVIAVALIGMGLFNLFYGFLIANVLMGFGMGFAGAGFNAGASLAVTADEQGAVAGLISACSSAGWIVGPLLGPVLYRLAPSLPFVSTAACVAAVSLFAWLKLRRPQLA